MNRKKLRFEGSAVYDNMEQGTEVNGRRGMVQISLLDFLQDASFGPVELGMSESDIERLLGPPDDRGGTSQNHRKPAIWLYGDIEFHFQRQSRHLRLIFMDHFGVPTGGPRIDLDPWCVREGLSRLDMEKHLRTACIEFHDKPRPFDETMSCIRTESRVELSFVEREEPFSMPLGLQAVSLGSATE